MGELILLTLMIAAAFAGLTARRRLRIRAGAPAEPVRAAARATPGTPRIAGIALVVALGLIWFAQLRLAGAGAPTAILVTYLAALAVVVILDRVAQASGETPGWVPGFPQSEEAAAPEPSQEERLSRRRRWLLGAGVLGSLIVADLTRGAPANAGHTWLALVWLLALGCVLASAWPSGGFVLGQWQERLAHVAARARVEWAVVVCILVGALLLRVVALDSVPYPFGGDEGSQAMSAVAVIEGKLTNPFGTGWYSVPTLFFFLQAASIAIFGDSVGGIRVVSALLGTLGVLFTFLLARRWFGPSIGVAAATLLAVFHFHVHFSRLASVQIADPLFLVATLFFLDRGLRDQRRFDSLLAGMAIGLSQYFYLSARIIPFIALAYALVLLVSMSRARSMAPDGGRELLGQLRLVGWTVIGAVLVFLPLAGYYVAHPEEFQGRFNQVSMFASGWLAEQEALTGSGAPALILQQVQRAVLLPFHTPPGGWYRGEPPFIGLPMAAVTAIGLAVITAGWFRPAYFGLAVAYWTVVLGLGLTDDPTQTQRLVIVAPIVAMLAAIALGVLIRIGVHVLGVRAALAQGLAGVVLIGLSAWNLHYYFHAPTQLRLYGDPNTMVATELAYQLRSLGEGFTVYFHAPPRMWYYGFQTLPFIARHATGIDVEQPLDSQTKAPSLKGPTLFVFVPERVGELEHVRAWFPNGRYREFTVGGTPSFTTYEVRPA